MREETLNSKQFLKRSGEITKTIEENINCFLHHYESTTLFESSLLFNNIVSDISNATLDWGR